MTPREWQKATSTNRASLRPGISIWAILCVTVYLVTSMNVSLSSADDASSIIDQLYESMRPSFVATWVADTACAQKEPQPEYLAWLHKFYYDGIHTIVYNADGWFVESARLLAKVSAGTAKDALDSALAVLGKRTSLEWAKPNDCRKVKSRGAKLSLEAFYKRLTDAAAKETGDGTSLSAAVAILNQTMDDAHVAK